jgi:glycosyltransferase involved in cell wall biosynthesis
MPVRPRIGVDFHTFDGLYQGSRSHLLGLYGEAVALAPEMDFVLLSAAPERLAEAHPAFRAAHVQCAALPHAGGLARLGWQLGLARRRHRIDLLHVQYRLPLYAGGPCACTIHDTLFETHPRFFTPNFVRMARWTSRLAVRQAALLFTVSGYSRDELVRLYGVDPARIAVTANGVDAQRFHAAADPASAAGQAEQAVLAAHGVASGAYLCTVGRIEPRKNHLGLLQAYARLRTPRPPLLVIGQRDFSDAPVFEAARTLGLSDEVRFMEQVDDAALPVLLRHALAFAYPSFAEGFGMPVAEAMASGVPVLTSDVTALPEVAGGAALLADPHDPAALAAAMQRLVDDGALRARLARAGLARAAALDWRRPAEVLVAALRASVLGA